MELEKIEAGTQLSLIDKVPDRIPSATKDTKDKVDEILLNQENSVVDKFLELDKLIESDSHIIYLKLTDIKTNHKKSHNYLGEDEYKTQFKQKKLSEIEKKVESVRRLKFKIIALGFLTNNKNSKIVVEKDVTSLLYQMFEKGLDTQTLIIEKQKEILNLIEREESLFSILEAKDKITDELKSTQALIIIDQNGLKRKKDSLYKKNKSIISEKIRNLGNYIIHITSILSNENITKAQQQEVNNAQEFIVKSQKGIFNEIEELLLKNFTDFIISEIVEDLIFGNLGKIKNYAQLSQDKDTKISTINKSKFIDIVLYIINNESKIRTKIGRIRDDKKKVKLLGIIDYLTNGKNSTDSKINYIISKEY